MNKVLNETMTILMRQSPEAQAEIMGSSTYPGIQGSVSFYPLWRGSLVIVSVSGLPENEKECSESFFGFHIHEGRSCTGNGADPFAETGQHYNPGNCPHPAHAGDFPPLLGNGGYALSIFYTDQFFPEEIVGRTVVIHSMPDDFRTQPSGDSGEKIACGEIK